MASFSPLLSSILMLLLVVVPLMVSPTSSKARQFLDNPHGFRIGLRHVDSKGNYTKLELVQRGINRGRHRLVRLTSMASTRCPSNSSDQIQSPVHAGNGEYLMDIAIGTPPNSYSAIMDTGSDLIWTQCKPCVKCYKQATPIFDPAKSSSFTKLPCSSNLCRVLENPVCDDGCVYKYGYGDSSSTQGVMASETFTFGTVSVPNVAFGCGQANEGNGFAELEGAGLVGLGRGPLSLVSQLNLGKFSYCLTSLDENRTSTLLLGSLTTWVATHGETKTTPLIQAPTQPTFYHLSLEGITVADGLLPIAESAFSLKEDGSGGLIIDSGTTITYLEESSFKLVKKAFVEHMKLPVADASSTGLDLCFSLPKHNYDNIDVPKLIFHFEGTDLDLPSENYMVADQSLGLVCLAIKGSAGLSILGNIQQQNMLVLHDLDNQKLSFTPTNCAQL